MWTPFNYEHLNALMASRIPNSLHDNDSTTKYFERYFMQKAVSALDITMPKEWEKDFVLYALCAFGYCIVTDTDEYGVIPQVGALSGVGLYFQPTTFTISNSLVQKKGLLGKDGEVVKMTPDYYGIFDMIHQYAYKMSLIYSALDQSLINSRLAWALAAKNKNAAQTLKAAMDKILRGEPGVIIDKVITDDDASESPILEIMNRNPQDNYITDLLLRDAQTLETRFDREVGIPDITENKGERLTAQEASEMNASAQAKITLWVENLNESFEKVRQLYGISCHARVRDLRVKEGGEEDAGSTDTDRNAES